jgi:hypothetical protein
MTARPPEITRPFSSEYLHACGVPVKRMFDALREFVDVNYVKWLESELTKARVR